MSSTTLALLFMSVSQQLNLPPGLLSALCFTESNHNVRAIHVDDGNANSVGVCQIQPSTAHLLGYKGTEKALFDPRTNVLYSGKYLSFQLRRYHSDIRCAIGAYNSGTCRLNDAGQIKNRKYVDKVMKYWRQGK